MNYRIGFGYDVHRLSEDRELWLGGIKIEHSVGLLGHSDADVLIHAMKACMAKIMGTDEDAISIKATTSERMGFVGREEGMAAYATALIVKKEK